MIRKSSAWLWVMLVLTAAGFATTPYLAFNVSPIPARMTFAQKIFYYHVPCAWAMLFGAIICGVASGIYLFRRSARADRVALATGELTVLFGILVLITGPLWAKKAWGHYWVWDPRLTSLLMLFLTFVGVMLVRQYAGPMGQRIAAGVALFGALNVPLVYISVRIWKTNHPSTNVVMTLAPSMRAALWLSVATFTLLFGLLLWARLRLERMRTELDDLTLRAAEKSLR